MVGVLGGVNSTVNCQSGNLGVQLIGASPVVIHSK